MPDVCQEPFKKRSTWVLSKPMDSGISGFRKKSPSLFRMIFFPGISARPRSVISEVPVRESSVSAYMRKRQRTPVVNPDAALKQFNDKKMADLTCNAI